MNRPEINVTKVIDIIMDIENRTGVKCLSYGLYDKKTKEFISIENESFSYDYHYAYENRCRFKYTHDKAVIENPILYLFRHHGEIYFPMLMKDNCKAYIAQFDVTELLSKYGENHSITPNTYYKEKFCWTKKEKKRKECDGQLMLPLAEMI